MDTSPIQTGPVDIWNSMGIVGQTVLVFLFGTGAEAEPTGIVNQADAVAILHSLFQI